MEYNELQYYPFSTIVFRDILSRKNISYIHTCTYTHTLSLFLTYFIFPEFSFIPFFSSAFDSQHTYLSLSLSLLLLFLSLSASYFEHVCFFKKIIITQLFSLLFLLSPLQSSSLTSPPLTFSFPFEI